MPARRLRMSPPPPNAKTNHFMWLTASVMALSQVWTGRDVPSRPQSASLFFSIWYTMALPVVSHSAAHLGM